MVSLQALNVIVNALLWVISGLFARVVESIYVSIAKIQLNLYGKTRATDSAETDIFQLLLVRTGACVGINGFVRNRTAHWVFVLILFSLCFLPAELIVETGVDERNNCAPRDEMQDGVCATPWQGHSDVGVACSALLVANFTWEDEDWDVVYEGSNPRMNPRELHVTHLAGKQRNGRSEFARRCQVKVESCEDCGTLTVEKDGGAFDTVIGNASLAEEVFKLDLNRVNRECPSVEKETRVYQPYRGDLTYDFATGMAFFFWALPCQSAGNETEGTGSLYEIRARGVESILNEPEIKRVLLGSSEPWALDLQANRTRLYEISCQSPGLGWKDLMKAVSIYRTIQMEQPGLQRSSVDGVLDRVPALSRSDVLKALFALKAEDIRSDSCERFVPVYQQCGYFRWKTVSVLVGLASFAVVLATSLKICVMRRANVSLPYNAVSWRRLATHGNEQTELKLSVSPEKGVEDVVVGLQNVNFI